jgi:hypothetical protein
MYQNRLTLPVAIRSTKGKRIPVAVNAPKIMIKGGADCQGILTFEV